MIKCSLGASYSSLSDEAQYPKILNRTYWLHPPADRGFDIRDRDDLARGQDVAVHALTFG